MTLLRLAEKHQYAVIEMGANHLGEIAHLCLPRSCEITVTLLSKIFRSKLLLLILLAKILPPSPKLTSPLIKQGLEKTQAEKGRLNIIQKSNLTLIDDSYNASPSSSKYALKVLNSLGVVRLLLLCYQKYLDQNCYC
jgi:UDP-N-acetylmuramyl pentapeptide synthase